MAATPGDLTAAALAFLGERHLATLSTLRADGTVHVVPVGFTWDDTTRLARVIASRTSVKVRHAAERSFAALCQVDGRHWLTLEGTAVVSDDRDRVAEAVRRYAQRYRQPRENPRRVAVEITVTRVLGHRDFVGT